jgi:uncharacterized repeat protein (TIGR01451 family)
VSNTGPLTAVDVKLDDDLPTTGGLTWAVLSTSQGTCAINAATQHLHCDLGNIAPAPGTSTVTVVVHSSNVGGAPAAACTQLDNIGTASATNAESIQIDGHQSCTPPPHLKVVKTPDGATFTQGGPISFTIVVSNDGGSGATNAKLTDQLPTAGGLNWSAAVVTTTQGSCSVSAGSLLTCSFGTIPKGGSVTVTVSLANTPAAACQNQPNPDAQATADGGLVADDAGSLTCTPPVNLVTVTQGGWGTPPHGNNPGAPYLGSECRNGRWLRAEVESGGRTEVAAKNALQWYNLAYCLAWCRRALCVK